MQLSPKKNKRHPKVMTNLIQESTTDYLSENFSSRSGSSYAYDAASLNFDSSPSSSSDSCSAIV